MDGKFYLSVRMERKSKVVSFWNLDDERSPATVGQRGGNNRQEKRFHFFSFYSGGAILNKKVVD